MAGIVAPTEAPAPAAVAELPRSTQPEAKTASTKAVAREFQNLPERKGVTAQEQDVQLVTLATVLKKGHALTSEDFKDGKSVTSLSIAEFYKKDKARAEVEFLTHMLNPDFQDTNNLTGEPMMASVEGKQQQVTRIKSRDRVFFTCEVGGKEVKLPVSEVISAQIVSMFKSPEVRALFTADEMIVIEAHLDSLAGKPEKAGLVDSAKLKELALSSGLVSVDSLMTFAEANGLKLRKTDPAKLAEIKDDAERNKVIAENEAHNQRVSEALKLFEGREVAPPEAVATVIQTLLPEQIGPLKLSLSEQMIKIKKELSQLKVDDPKDRQMLTDLSIQEDQINQQLLMIQQAEQFMQDGQVAVMEIFGRVQNGEDVAIIQSLDKGLEKNDPTAIVGALLSKKNLPEAAAAEIKKAIDYMKIGKIGGGISIGFFFMMLWKAISGEGLLGAAG